MVGRKMSDGEGVKRGVWQEGCFDKGGEEYSLTGRWGDQWDGKRCSDDEEGVDGWSGSWRMCHGGVSDERKTCYISFQEAN